MLILKYEKGRVPKKKGKGEHPAKSAYADHCKPPNMNFAYLGGL